MVVLFLLLVILLQETSMTVTLLIQCFIVVEIVVPNNSEIN